MMYLKQEKQDSVSLTSKHDKEFSAIIFQYIYLIIFYISIFFCLLSFDEITNLVVQNKFSVSSVYFYPINSDVGLFKQWLLVTLSAITRCLAES